MLARPSFGDLWAIPNLSHWVTRAESKAAAKILADWHERLVQVSPLACRRALPPIELLNVPAHASGLSVVRRQRP
jgi:hypothetical protein